MSVYARVGDNFQQVDGECPNGWIVMNSQRPDGEDTGLYTALADGTWAITPETMGRIWASREAAWVSEEMQAVADQLLLHDDEDDLALATRAEWVDYRKALRRWTEGAEGFPDIDQRPARPA